MPNKPPRPFLGRGGLFVLPNPTTRNQATTHLHLRNFQTISFYLSPITMATIRCAGKTYHNIRAVLFDKDGTLANTAPYLVQLGQYRARAVAARLKKSTLSNQTSALTETEAQLLTAFGFENEQLNPAGLLAVASRMQTETAAAAFVVSQIKDWHEAMAIAQAAFQDADQQMPRKAATTHLFEAARPILEHLHQSGTKLGIISADITANIDDFVDYHKIQPLIDIAWGNDKPPSKPNPEAYRQVCKQLEVLPEETLMVGDAEGDMSMAKGAQAAGCIGVTWGWANSTPIPKQTPNQIQTLPSADVTLSHWHEFEAL